MTVRSNVAGVLQGGHAACILVERGYHPWITSRVWNAHQKMPGAGPIWLRIDVAAHRLTAVRPWRSRCWPVTFLT